MRKQHVSLDSARFRSFEAAGWENKADAYHRFFGAISAHAIGPLLHAAEVGSSTRVLDVATGPGYVAARAALLGATVTGVDFAEGMVALAARLHPSIEFRQADAENLPFPDESFDALVANLLVHHLAYPEATVAEFARVLTRGGRLALTTWDGPDKMRLMGVFGDAVQAAGASAPADLPAGPPVFRFAEDQQFKDLLESAGLTDVRIERISFIHVLPNVDELWDGVLSSTVRTPASILGQPAELQTRIRAEFDRLMLPYTKPDGVYVPVAIVLSSGRKATAG